VKRGGSWNNNANNCTVSNRNNNNATNSNNNIGFRIFSIFIKELVLYARQVTLKEYPDFHPVPQRTKIRCDLIPVGRYARKDEVLLTSFAAMWRD